MLLRKVLLNKLFYILIASMLLSGCQDKDQQVTATNNEPDIVVIEDPVHNIDYSSLNLKLLDISEREVGRGNAIVLLFNAPLSADQDFSRFIDITPVLASPVLSQDGRKLEYTGITPETQYEISIVAGVKAQHDSQLSNAHQQTLTTRAMSPVISFKSKEGALLIPGSSEELQIYSVNVAQADLNIYRVQPNQIARFFRQFKNLAKSKAYYYRNQNRSEMVEHLYTARIETNGPANERHLSKFPLQGQPWANESGVYFATLGKPGAFEYEAATWFSVSSIGLQVRQFPKYTYIITQNIKTGELLENVQVDLLDVNSRRFASETSNEHGVIKLPKNNKLNVIMAKQGTQVTVLPYQQPQFDLSDFTVDGQRHSATQLFAYAPRDIYRPGETATISILHRDHDGQVKSEPLSLKIYKPDSSQFKSLWLKASDPENGYYEYAFDLPKSSQVGNWQARITAKGESQYSARFHFKVEDFIPERLRIGFNDDQSVHTFNPEQGLKVNVTGEYLYGAPASGNRLDTRGKVSAWTKPFPQWQDYHVGDTDSTTDITFNLRSATLNEEGKHLTKVNQNWSRWASPMKVRLYYSLFETGGRALNRFHDALLWPKATYIAVKPSFENDQSPSNDKIHFNLLKLNQEGHVIPQGETKVELVREEERYFWSYNDQKGWHYERIAKSYVVDSRTLSFVEQAPLIIEQMVEWGAYRLELTDLTSKGKTVYRFRAGEPWYNRWNSNSNTLHPDKINLALDKGSYLPGEPLTLSIASPHKGIALISIETDQVLLQKQVALSELLSKVTLNVPDELKRHDAYISVFVIAPSDPQVQSVAKRSFGIVHLPLTRDQRQLDVILETQDSWKPDQQVSVKVLVQDQQGVPVTGNAKVTLSAVDSGVLSVSNYQVEDPYSFIYGRRAYLGKITDMYDQVLEPLLADATKLRWGGDAALTRGGEKPDGDVQIVSLFSGLVNVKNGVAEIPLTIPTFDGELTLTAVAFSQDDVGKAEKSVVVASPVVAQISLPKFLAINDVSDVTLDMTNVTEQTLEGELIFESGGALVTNIIKLPVSLMTKKKQTFTFKLNAAQKIGIGEITSKFTSNGDTITRQWTLPVRAAQPAEYHRSSAYLMPGESVQLQPGSLDKLLVDTRQLQLRVGVSPNLKAGEHWRYLTRYPYGCLEQTTSKSRPFASVLTDDGKASSMPETDIDEIHKKTLGAISRYRELQRADGSFGLWSKQSPEAHWLTAYATDFLYTLKDKGVVVPNEMLNKASQRLQSYLSNRSRHSVQQWTNSPAHYAAAYRAYAAYVLAKQAKVTLGPLRDVAERDLPHASGKLPHVHLGLAMLLTGSESEGEALILKGLSKPRGYGYLGDYGSDIRDTVTVIDLLLSHEQVSLEIKKQALALLLELANEIEQSRWLSTQERSAILALAMTIQQYSQQAWQGELNMAGALQTLTQEGEYYKTLPANTVQSTSFKNTGTQPIYAAFDWSGVAEQPNYNIEQGISVFTEHFLVNNGNATKLADNAQLTSGDILLSRISILSETRVADALLINLMPAGLELENQNLNNSLKLSGITIEGQGVENTLHIEHQEYRDDRYVAAIDLRKQYSQSLYILSRAVNPGQYVFPAVRVESMYRPEIQGSGGNIQQITVVNGKTIHNGQ